MNINIFELGILIPILIVFIIFSLLPDIDHPKSKISGVFRISMVLIIIYSVLSFFVRFNILNLLSALFAIALITLHGRYAEDSYNHRKFPHTITFSLISCIILFFLSNSMLNNNSNSLIITGVGVFSIFSHIWVDKYMHETFMHFKNNKNYFVKINPLIASEKNIPHQFNAFIVRSTKKAIMFKLIGCGKNEWIPKSQIEYLQCISDYNSPVIINSYTNEVNNGYEYNNGNEVINESDLGYEDIKEIIYVFIQSGAESNLFFEDLVNIFGFDEGYIEEAVNDLIQEGRLRFGSHGFYAT